MIGRRELAKRAGVSTTTITRILSGNGSVSAETMERVEKIIRESGYTRNAIASSLAKNSKSNMIALLVPDMTNYYYMNMFDAMVRAARRYGCVISIYSISTSNVAEVVDEVIANRASGIVNMGLVPITHDCLRRVNSADIKFIYTGVKGHEPFTVHMDYGNAVESAVRHLRATNCERVGFLFGMKQKLLHDDKVRAFRHSLEKNGYACPDDYIVVGSYPVQSAIETGYQKAKELYTGRVTFDALFCLNDMMAIGAVRAIRECGWRVPEDVSVIGFDDILLTEYSMPSLSTIRSDIYAEAKAYVRFCMGDMEETEMEIRSRFIPRDSVRMLPPAEKDG